MWLDETYRIPGRESSADDGAKLGAE